MLGRDDRFRIRFLEPTGALLHKSAFDRTPPFAGQTCPETSGRFVPGVMTPSRKPQASAIGATGPVMDAHLDLGAQTVEVAG